MLASAQVVFVEKYEKPIRGSAKIERGQPDLKFVKKFTRPNFWAKEFYTLKTRISRVFSPAINSENASLSVI